MMRIRIVLLVVLFASNLLVSAQSERSNELFVKGMELYQAGKYREAIPVFEQVDALDRQEMDTTKVRFGYISGWLSSCWYKLGDTEKARQIDKSDYETQPIDRRLTVVSDSIYQLGVNAFEAYDNEEALRLFLQCIKQQSEDIPFICPHRIVPFIFTAFILQGMEKTDDAMAFILKAGSLCDQILSPDNDLRLDVMKYTCDILINAGRLEEGGGAMADYAEHLRSIGQQDSDRYLNLMQEGLQLACDMGDVEVVKDAYPIVLDMLRERYGLSSEEYVNKVGDIASMLSQLGDTTCVSLGEDFCMLTEAKYGPDSKEYFRASSLMYGFAVKGLRTDLMRQYLKEVIRLMPIHEPDHPENLPLSQIMLAMTFILEDADSASVLANNGLTGLDELGMTGTPYYAMGQYVQGIVKALTGQYQEADDLLSSTIGVLPVNDSISLFNNQLMLAYVRCMSGRYVEGRQLGMETIAQIRSSLDSPFMGATSRGVLPMLKQMITIFDNAHTESIFTMPDSVMYTYGLLHRELLLLEMEQQAKLDSFETGEFFVTMEKYGHTSYRTRDYLHTRQVVGRYADIIKSRYGEQSWEYDRCLDALLHCYEDEDPEKLRIYERQIALEQKLYGKKSEWVLDKMEKYYLAKGDNEAYLALKSKKKKNMRKENSLKMANIYKANDNYESALRYYRESFLWQVKNKGERYNLYYASDGVLECLKEQGQTQLLPQELVTMMKHVSERCPDDLRYLVFSLAALKFHAPDTDTYQQCVEALVTSIPQLADPETQACLLTQAYIHGYIREAEIPSVEALFDKALSLTKDVNKTLYDELLLCKLKTSFDSQISSLGSVKYDAFYLKSMGQQMEQLLKAYPERMDCYDYYDAIASQLKSAILRHQSDEITRLSEILLPALKEKHGYFCDGGEMGRITNQQSLLNRRIANDQDLEDLVMEAAMLGDARQQVRLALPALQKRLDMVRSHLASQYYRSSVQDDIDKLIHEATYLAFLTGSDTLAATAYNASIYCKGALLRSEKQMERHILTNGNETSRLMLQELRTITLQLDDATDANPALTDSLAVRKTQLENQLMGMSAMFGDYTRAMMASWRDVQQQLGNHDAAIEFCQYERQDTMYYCALLLKPDGHTPHLVPLCTSQQLAAVKNIYTDNEIYNLVWKPLEQLLADVRNVYFSPTGVLHQMAIESVLDDNRQLISQKYNLRRLSNTRELIRQKTDPLQNNAFLVGGVSYQLGQDDWHHIAQTAARPFDNVYAMRDVGSLEELRLRGALDDLPGTEVEVDDITREMDKSHIRHLCIKGTDASEDRFKQVSGSDYTIIHIATHGFWLTTDTLISQRGRVDKDNMEDVAMSRCGLLMAGSESYIKGEPVPDNVDDGILTAREVSRLDLTSVSLVALSACETALGDVTGDGVFGLQRGFKKAGAQSILMSLWKVDDEATCLLMTEFYKHWIGEKKTKHEALQLAMKTVRSHKEKGWDDPKYWAAFILLDGLD